MKKIFVTFALLATMFVMTGCTEPVPPGTLGKIITTSGITEEVYEPGRPTVWGRDRLVLLETASQLRPAPVRVIMADHQKNSETGEVTQEVGLEMDFTVNIRYRLNNETSVINSMLADMSLQGVNKITATQVYQKYGNMVVGRVSREVLGQYTPEQVLTNLETINDTLDKEIKGALESSPLIVSSVSLGPISLPKIINDRININKDTELSEAQKRTEQRIAMLQKQNEIELSRQEAVKQKIDAQALAEQNRILNASITPEVLRLRELQLQEKRIDMEREVLGEGLKNGGSSVFIPYGQADSTAAQMRMYQK